jgi:hypothetical protein
MSVDSSTSTVLCSLPLSSTSVGREGFLQSDHRQGELDTVLIQSEL